jgi:O-antigen ligase
VRAGWAAWLVLALLLVLYPAAPGWFDTVWLMHVFAVAAWLVLSAPRLWRTPALRCGPPALLTAVALASLAAALLLAPDAAPRAEQRWAALTAVLHAAVFLLALGWFPGPEAPAAEARRAALGLCALLLAMCAVQITRGLLAAPWGEPDTRLSGSLGNPNTFGSLMAACALLVLGTGYALSRAPGADRRRTLLIAAMIAAPLGAALLASRSRGAMAALLLTLLLLAARWRKGRLLAAVGAAVLLLILVPNPLRERFANLRPDHVFTRPFLWSTALDVAREHPAGLGPAMYKYEFPARALDPERPWLLHQRHEVGLAHNVFLTLAVEWGWLAAGALLALLAWSAVRMLRARGGRDDPLRLGATLGACVLLLELQVDGLEQNQLVFTAFLLLAAAALARLPRPAGFDVSGRLLAVACVLAGLAVAGFAVGRERGYRTLLKATSQAVNWSPDADADPGRNDFMLATAQLPGEQAPWREWLDYETRVLRGLLDAGVGFDDPRVREAMLMAHNAADGAVRSNGLDPDPRRQGATLDLLLYRRSKQPALFERYLEQAQAALVLDPLDVDGHFDLAQEARRMGRRELSDHEFEEVFRLEPDHAFAWFVRSRLLQLEDAREEALYALVRAEEAVLNDRIKASVDSPRSRSFFEDLLRKVDLADVRTRLVALRRQLYF